MWSLIPQHVCKTSQKGRWFPQKWASQALYHRPYVSVYVPMNKQLNCSYSFVAQTQRVSIRFNPSASFSRMESILSKAFCRLWNVLRLAFLWSYDEGNHDSRPVSTCVRLEKSNRRAGKHAIETPRWCLSYILIIPTDFRKMTDQRFDKVRKQYGNLSSILGHG